MTLKLITGPTSEPVSLAEARLQLRFDSDNTADDSRISGLIEAARQQAEHELGRALVTQTWEASFDEFPAVEIELGKPNVQSITTVKYIEADGDEQTIAASNYYLDNEEPPGFLLPAEDYEWPETMDTANAVRVRFVAGYGAASAVPQAIKTWILLCVEYMFRGQPMPEGLNGMLDPFRVYG
jgi:uncharacterized phiE125 gp8 family phage protein